MRSFIIMVMCFGIVVASVDTEEVKKTQDESRSSTHAAAPQPCELAKLFSAYSNKNQGGDAGNYALQIAQLYALLNALNSAGANGGYKSQKGSSQYNHVAPASYQSQSTSHSSGGYSGSSGLTTNYAALPASYSTSTSSKNGASAHGTSSTNYAPLPASYSTTTSYGNGALALVKKLTHSSGSGSKYGLVPALYSAPPSISSYSSGSKSYFSPESHSIKSEYSAPYAAPASYSGFASGPTSYSKPSPSVYSKTAPSYSAQGQVASYSSGAPASTSYSAGENSANILGRTPSTAASMEPSVANLYARYANSGSYAPEQASGQTYNNYNEQNVGPSSGYGNADAVVPVPVCPKNYLFSCQAHVKHVPCEQPAGPSY